MPHPAGADRGFLRAPPSCLRCRDPGAGRAGDGRWLERVLRPARPRPPAQGRWRNARPSRADVDPSCVLEPEARRALGTCHGLRRAHLRRYLDEGVFRWNRRRHTATAFDTPLGIGTRLRPADCRDSAGQHVRSPQAGRQPPPALRSASIGAECRPANLHDSARNQLPQVQNSRKSPGTARKPRLERRTPINIWGDRKQRDKPYI